MKSFLFFFASAAIFCLGAAISSRIIGGDPAWAGQFQFAVAITVTKSDGIYFCGGSLVTLQWVLTAGQCVDDAVTFTIVMGALDLNNGNDSNVLRVATSSYVLYPDYDPLTLENDIGLIELRMPIEITMYINEIQVLPTLPLEPGTEASAIGWGQIGDSEAGLSEELRWTLLTVLSDEECRLVYGSQIKDGMICAGGNFNEGTCHVLGDTGGPLMQDLGRGYRMQIGVASFISGNGCESTDPSGYTKLLPYMDWLRNVTGRLH